MVRSTITSAVIPDRPTRHLPWRWPTLPWVETVRSRPIYAAAGVPLYWIINLVDDQIEVYTQPTGPDPVPDYQMRQDYKGSDLVPLVIDGIELGPIPGCDLLP